MADQNMQTPDSPRRRKPPLDLDAALFLQSQANYVQEPNNARTTSAASLHRHSGVIQSSYANQLAGSRLSLQQQQQQQQQHHQFYRHPQNPRQQLLAQQQEALHSSLQHLRRDSSVCCCFDANQPVRQQQPISVDYIDCVSNNDLSPAVRTAAMPSIPRLCKRHARFHRGGARVEPAPLAESVAYSASSNHLLEQPVAQQPAPTTDASSSSSGAAVASDEQQTNETTAAAAASDARAASSVLYPISVEDVKKRTYFIGSVSQDSLLGQDELYRYFPDGKVSVFVCTWNQNRKRAPGNLNDLLLPERLMYLPDMYAIGIQEAFSSQSDYLREWEIELQTTLGPNHVLLHSSALGALHLAIFVRRDLIWFCSSPEESSYNSRSMPTNMMKTKGAVSVAFRFFGTSFMFTNCHFPAHENKLKDRIDEYQRIINSIDLPKNLKLLKPRYLSNDSTARFDCVFLMGDLNFRLEQRTFDETIHIMDDIFQLKHHERSYEALTQHDELLKVMESGQAFHGFDEAQITFPPTYKFLAKTNKYDRQTKRVPSYTDRILFRSKRQRHIECLLYDWMPQLLSSDHKPVYSVFNVLVRPGHQQESITTSSLNAGLFQRAVYIEALKRRTEGPADDAMRNVGGNLICSIS